MISGKTLPPAPPLLRRWCPFLQGGVPPLGGGKTKERSGLGD